MELTTVRAALVAFLTSGGLRRLRHDGEPLWSIQNGHVTWSCELRFNGETARRWVDERDRLEGDDPFA